MECYICGAVAQESEFADGCKSVECTDCGWYDVSGTVLAMRTYKPNGFDVEQTRQWLIQQRRVYPDRNPFIESGNVRWAL